MHHAKEIPRTKGKELKVKCDRIKVTSGMITAADMHCFRAGTLSACACTHLMLVGKASLALCIGGNTCVRITSEAIQY